MFNFNTFTTAERALSTISLIEQNFNGMCCNRLLSSPMVPLCHGHDPDGRSEPPLCSVVRDLSTTWPPLHPHLLCISNERWQAPQLIQHSWPMWPRCWERPGQCVGHTRACRADPPGLACAVASTVDWRHSETVNSHAPRANDRLIELSLAAFFLTLFFCF